MRLSLAGAEMYCACTTPQPTHTKWPPPQQKPLALVRPVAPVFPSLLYQSRSPASHVPYVPHVFMYVQDVPEVHSHCIAHTTWLLYTALLLRGHPQACSDTCLLTTLHKATSTALRAPPTHHHISLPPNPERETKRGNTRRAACRRANRDGGRGNSASHQRI
jgi:hypothetical protein